MQIASKYFFFPTNNASGHPEIHIFVLGLEVFGRFRKKIGGRKSSLNHQMRQEFGLFFLWL